MWVFFYYYCFFVFALLLHVLHQVGPFAGSMLINPQGSNAETNCAQLASLSPEANESFVAKSEGLGQFRNRATFSLLFSSSCHYSQPQLSQIAISLFSTSFARIFKINNSLLTPQTTKKQQKTTKNKKQQRTKKKKKKKTRTRKKGNPAYPIQQQQQQQQKTTRCLCGFGFWLVS